MPRRRSKSTAGSILDFFRLGDAGEVKVIYQLVEDVMRERFTLAAKPPATPIRRQPRKVNASTATTVEPAQAASEAR